MKFYLVGIKGVGMCALANILLELGYFVKGCDFLDNFMTSKLLKKIEVENINNLKYDNKYTYIIGNAFKNSSYIECLDNYNCYDYPDFIEKFFRMPKISISGTHGKTTTTSFISQLTNKNINLLCGDGSSKASKQSDYLVLEACEYKDTFLNYTNKILLINNIELDHPDYFKNIDEVITSFQKAAYNSQIVIVNGDDVNCSKIEHYNKIKFGMNDENDIKFIYENNVVTIMFYGNNYTFILDFGLYNIYNFVAAFIICKLLDTDDLYLNEQTKKLFLPQRRLNKYTINKAIIYDDYAHHPTEIKKTLLYLKDTYKDRKIILFFQPHTYSRTKIFLNDFISALSIAHETYILDVFSSIREKGDGNLLLDNSNFNKFDDKILKEIKYTDNIYVFMGAGDINKLIKIAITIE